MLLPEQHCSAQSPGAHDGCKACQVTELMPTCHGPGFTPRSCHLCLIVIHCIKDAAAAEGCDHRDKESGCFGKQPKKSACLCMTAPIEGEKGAGGKEGWPTVELWPWVSCGYWWFAQTLQQPTCFCQIARAEELQEVLARRQLKVAREELRLGRAAEHDAAASREREQQLLDSNAELAGELEKTRFSRAAGSAAAASSETQQQLQDRNAKLSAQLQEEQADKAALLDFIQVRFL